MFGFLFTLLATIPPAPAAESRPVKVRPEATLYSGPGEVGQTPWTWNRNKVQCFVSPTVSGARGKVAFERDGVAAVELDALPEGCADRFNASARDRRLVYVPTGDLTDDDGSDQTEAGSLDVNCVNCGAKKSDLRAVVDADPVLRAMANSGLGDRVGDEKTPEQLEQYLACHATKWQSNYDRMYRRLFDLAGKTFQVTYEPGKKDAVKALTKASDMQSSQGNPFWLHADPGALKCTALRESRWDPNAESATGARGLGQQVDINVTEVGCLIAGCGKRKAAPWARDLWSAYFKGAREMTKGDPALYKEMTTRPNGTACREKMLSKDLDAVCPINSIAAAAINKLAAALSARQKSSLYKASTTQDFSESERFDLNVLTATTNNAGSGNLSKAVLGGASLKEWLKRLPKVDGDADRQKEIGDYQQFMKNCLQAGNFKSVWPLQKGEKPKDCSAFKRARVATGQ